VKAGAIQEQSAIAIFDVAYAAAATSAACLVAEGWQASEPIAQHIKRSEDKPAAYEPGNFYLRELPLILALIEQLTHAPEVLIVDGYAWLGGLDRPGLGARLYEAVHGSIPVVGIAKTRFRDDTWSTPVYRGTSKHPLLVTAAGMPQDIAAEHVRAMHGANRMPTLLRAADRLACSANLGQSDWDS
jgi:deoxyribonuclease V